MATWTLEQINMVLLISVLERLFQAVRNTETETLGLFGMVAVHWKEEKEGQREMHGQDQSSVLQLGLEFGFNPKKSVCPTWVPSTAPDA